MSCVTVNRVIVVADERMTLIGPFRLNVQMALKT